MPFQAFLADPSPIRNLIRGSATDIPRACPFTARFASFLPQRFTPTICANASSNTLTTNSHLPFPVWPIQLSNMILKHHHQSMTMELATAAPIPVDLANVARLTTMMMTMRSLAANEGRLTLNSFKTSQEGTLPFRSGKPVL